MIFDAYIRLAHLTSTAQEIVTALLVALLIIYELSGENETYKSGRRLLIPYIVIFGIAVGAIIIQGII